MFGKKSTNKKNTALSSPESQAMQNKVDTHDQWDKFEQADDVYCSDSFNLFNDVY